MASTVSPDLSLAEPTAPPRTRLGRFGLAGFVVGVLLVVALVTRLALLAYDWRALDASPYEILKALLVGEVFDVLASLWIVAPLVLAVALVPDRWFGWRFTRGWVRFWLFFLFALSAFVIAAEVLFFDEFNGRFNFVAVDYLIFPTEVVTNLWESYPLPAILLGVVGLGVLGMWLARRRIAAAMAAATPGRTRLAALGGFAATLGALTFGVTPEMGKVSDDRALNEIAMNGYYTFWMAFMGQDAPYEGLYATRPVREEAARIKALVVDPERRAGSAAALGAAPGAERIDALPAAGPLMARGTTAEPAPAAVPEGPAWSPERPTERRVVAGTSEVRRNVVVVLEESLGAIFLASLHPRGDTVLTPRFDSLIAEGTVLANAYSTGNRTIRALEATTSSLPPLPGISVVRRPASRDLFTLPAVLRERGYATSFIYGGR
ncbi:MAG TPA: sulfatase-like hydrolase/transferase, partial [Gemmatimonadaceae bacterium]|nr:sulfatase-like hydrolase/transferase [Gemmatimonadaceae bacterium]